MLSWKDKATEKLSQLFSDTSSSHSPPPHQSQAKPYPNEDKSSSSIFSFNLPSLSFDGFTYNKDRRVNKPIAKSWQNKPLDSCEGYDHESENKRTSSSQAEDQEYGSGRSNEHVNRGALKNHNNSDAGSARSTRSSDVFEDATNLCNVDQSMACLTVDSCFISSDLYVFLMSSLPNIVKGCQWLLLYSTAKHGISLHTLIRRSADHSGPCLLVCPHMLFQKVFAACQFFEFLCKKIVGDKQGAVFGGLLDCPLKPTPKRKYQGTIQTFVFTTIYGEPRLFRPTGANRYFYMCLSDLLALGGGGNFALCLDEDLLTGTSGPCETFGNLCLAHSQEFELKNVELWGFAHSSRYLT